MKVQELKYNLYLVNFADVEREILQSVKKEFDKFGIISYEEIPKKDYVKLLQYFTLQTVCKTYNSLNHKKNTIFFTESQCCNREIVEFLKEIKKYFPIPIYISTELVDMSDPAVAQEITLKLKEFRYSIDYSRFSFVKIKRFCKKHELESLTTDFKL